MVENDDEAEDKIRKIVSEELGKAQLTIDPESVTTIVKRVMEENVPAKKEEACPGCGEKLDAEKRPEYCPGCDGELDWSR